MRCTLLTILVFSVLFILCADYDLLEDPDKTPEPVSLEIIELTDSTVTLRWTQCRDEDFKQYEVYYGTNDIVDRNDKCADSLTFNIDTVKTVGPLDDMTRYYFRVIVFNDMENFSVSNIVDTVTLEDMEGKLKCATPTLTDDGEVRLSWTAAQEESSRYVIHADTLRTVDTTDTIIATVYSDTTELIGDLLTGHTWRFRVFAWNDTAIVASSNTVKIFLSDD